MGISVIGVDVGIMRACDGIFCGLKVMRRMEGGVDGNGMGWELFGWRRRWSG